MSGLAISAEGIGKRYQLGAAGAPRYRTLRESLSTWVPSALRRPREHSGRRGGSFWALRDVSFDVHHGESLGIIGRNGAGKSTLLKILSRITKPTTGRAIVRGRVNSLLEVGTGFHPELTGRENVFLSAAISGMPRSEITRKFDEIVAFAELAEFIDTPVKRYSSGMYMRLAFAVAAHLEPDILLVDEVLAVGDAGFQAKCLGKMHDVTGSGRTVLFVSHNLSSVASLTQKCLLLGQGRLLEAGPTAAVIGRYLAGDERGGGQDGGEFDLVKAPRALDKHNPATARAYWAFGRVLDARGDPTPVIREREDLLIEVEVEVRSLVTEVELGATVRTSSEANVFSVLSRVYPAIEPGTYVTHFRMAPNFLRPGQYSVTLGLYTAGRPDGQDGIKHAIWFRIEPSPEGYPNPRWSRDDLGTVRLPYEWSAIKLADPARRSRTPRTLT